MSLFKRKKKEEEQDIKKEKKREEKLAKIREAKKKEKKEKPGKEKKAVEKKLEVIKPQSTKAKKDEVKTAPGVLSQPQITEKATLLQESNQYIFRVFLHSSKPEVRKSVEEVYGVNVEKIRIVNVRRKRKRLGRTTGWKQGYKKAIVSLRKGQTIEIMPR
ncbi:MAG: 50S ribosomal protein L23 [Candidatus Pacebacteria bacterium]|nr:50S ribosomal protein L23 [Candidatus Paceibacterota bacterium]